MIAIIDYDAGNIKSVEKALQKLGADVLVTKDAKEILQADKVILPGVGAFGVAMANLKKFGLDKVIYEVVEKGTPFLGICLGLQLLFERSDETPGVAGLGILKGEILRIPDKEDLKIPHMGWNGIEELKTGLFDGVEEGAFVYYVHSFHALMCDEAIAVSHHGVDFCGALCKGNFYGTQFHPEKSGATGARILHNFLI